MEDVLQCHPQRPTSFLLAKEEPPFSCVYFTLHTQLDLHYLNLKLLTAVFTTVLSPQEAALAYNFGIRLTSDTEPNCIYPTTYEEGSWCSSDQTIRAVVLFVGKSKMGRTGVTTVFVFLFCILSVAFAETVENSGDTRELKSKANTQLHNAIIREVRFAPVYA